MVVDQLAQPRVRVPFLDLSHMHAPIKDALLDDLARLVDSGAFSNGPDVGVFEQAFADYCGSPYCVGTANGLDALRLALIAAGLERGDEVVVPAHTFVATLEAVTQAGGTPVVVDVDEGDLCLDADAAGAAITSRTRFLMPVHLYGQMADLRRLTGVAVRSGIELVEDACQAHGAVRDGIRAGTAGFAAAFSFYPGKNLGAMGDAGALTTRDAELATTVRALREHGQRAKYQHQLEGWTARLDTVQALFLLHKLPRLDGWNADRRRVASFYSHELTGVGDLALPPVPPGSVPVWHLYVVRTKRREQLASFLARRGIASGRHYPEPVHLTEAYSWLGHRRGEFPVAERLADECLSLPIYPGISEAQLHAVTTAVRAFFGG